MRQEEYIGFDTISQLRDILGRFGSQRIFLVTGKESYSSCGAKAYLDKILGDYEVSRFYEFEANPKIEDIQKGIKIFTHNSYDTVIAVGGGSVIDMAKAITFLAANPSAAAEYSIKGPPQATIAKPIVAIPTTSGSGSESTCFSVIYVGCKKYSISDENMLPKAAIVDAKLTMSLPVYTTAVSGLDAFSQAVESYWSIHSTYQSKQFASDAIKLTMGNLPSAVNNPTAEARLKMAKAAHLAGKAINITRTTAAHSISYPLTSHFGVSHGQAVGITLSSLLVFNADVSDEDVLDKRGADYVRQTIDQICKLLDSSNPSDAKKRIDLLVNQIGLQTKLSKLGLKDKQDVELIISNGFDPNRVKNNPRELTERALRDILQQIY